MLSDSNIKSKLKIAIEQFCIYIYKNRLILNQNDAKGQLFTCIRRNIPEIVNIKSGFCSKNIDTIHFDINNGSILYLQFIKSYSGINNDKLISLLNNTIEEIGIINKDLSFQFKIEKIIKEVETYI